MRIALCVLSGLLFIASPALAQKALFDGKWTGSMVSVDGDPIWLDLKVERSNATLRVSRRGYSPLNEIQDPCEGIDIPVVEESRSDTTMDFKVRADTVLRGCFKGEGTMKLVDGNKLQATLKDGRSFQLVRQ